MRLVRGLCPKCSWATCEKSQVVSPPSARAALTASCSFRLEPRGSQGSLQTLISARLLVSFTANSSVPDPAAFHNQTYINDLHKSITIYPRPHSPFTWRPIINSLNLIK